MRYTNIPDDIQLLNLKGEVIDNLSFTKWFEVLVLSDKAWGTNVQKLLMASDLLSRVRAAKNVFEISEAEWTEVKKIVETPSDGYNTAIALQTITFIKAVLDAKDKQLETPQNDAKTSS